MVEASRICLLGPVELEGRTKPLKSIESRKALALLAYLAVERRPIPRDQLVDLFWGDKTGARGRANLSWSLNRISSLFPASVLADRQSVQWTMHASVWLDVVAFETLSTREDGRSLQAMAELYRGEFLQGISLDDCPFFAAWLTQQRQRWQQHIAQTLHKLLHYHGQRGEYKRALNAGRHLLEIVPWQEEALTQVMRMLALDGQRLQALEQYEVCCTILKRELDTEPTEQTKTLYEHIRAMGDSAPHKLPMPPTAFIGRKAALAEVSTRLEDPHCRLLTLTGPGGIGKTRLALETTLSKRRHFLDGVFFVSLASLESAELIVVALTKALGLSLSGKDSPEHQLLRYVQAKEMLIVLDNFEHLVRGASVLTDILTHAHEVKLLITSRRALRLESEWVFEVSPLACPATAAEDIEQFGAVELFLQGARRVQQHPAWTPQDRLNIVRICRLVAGIPLGIELASSWVGSRSCQAIADELERNVLSMSNSKRDIVARHQNLDAAFDHSWALLSAAEKRLFCKLSVFRGGVSLDALDSVCTPDGVAQSEAQKLLTHLVEHALVRAQQHDTQRRFQLLEPLRQYAKNKLQQAGEAHTTEGRHVQFYLEFVEHAAPKLQGSEQIRWLERLTQERHNVRAALGRALDHGTMNVFLRLCSALWYYWDLSGAHEEGLLWLRKAGPLDGTPADPLIRAQALVAAGYLHWGRDDYERAQTSLEQSLALFEQHEDTAGSATALAGLGLVTRDRGQHAEAIRLLERSLSLFEQLNDSWGVANSFNRLALLAKWQGDSEKAERLWEDSLKRFREVGDRRGMGSTLNNLGIVRRTRSDEKTAASFHREALALFEELGFKVGVVYTLDLLGQVAQQQERYERATTWFERSLDVARVLGDAWSIANTLESLGTVALEQDQFKRAAGRLNESLSLFQRLDYKWSVASVLNKIATVKFSQGQLKRSQALFRESLTLSQQLNHVVCIVKNLEGISWVLACRGRFKQAALVAGATESLCETSHVTLSASQRQAHEEMLRATRSDLGDVAFEQRRGEGTALALQLVTGRALSWTVAETTV